MKPLLTLILAALLAACGGSDEPLEDDRKSGQPVECQPSCRR